MSLQAFSVVDYKPFSSVSESLLDYYEVYIYRCDGNKLNRKISGFNSSVTCCDFRPDNTIIAIGEGNGMLQLCSTNRETYHLRKIKAHKGSVTNTRFGMCGTRVASIGADSHVNVWDVSLGSSVYNFVLQSGKEPAKAIVTGRTDSNLLCSGSFDGSVSIFDLRQPKSSTIFKVSSAVSALALNSTDNLLAVANGTLINLWDTRASKFKPAYSELQLHYKLITDLKIANHPQTGEGELLLSVSMDKYLKMTRLESGEEVGQLRCPVGLSAVATSRDCETIVVGGDKGFLKTRHLDASKLPSTSSVTKPTSNDKDDEAFNTPGRGGLEPSFDTLLTRLSGRWRGGDQAIAMTTDQWLALPYQGARRAPHDWLQAGESVGSASKIVPLIHDSTEISRQSQQHSSRLRRVDHMLSRFSHTAALSHALRTHPHRRVGGVSKHELVQTCLAVIRELARRGTLVAALAGRDQVQLTRLLRFIRRNVWHRDSAMTCLQLFNCLLEIYSPLELAQLPEFGKVKRLLEMIFNNLRSLDSLILSIQDRLATDDEQGVVAKSAGKQKKQA